MGRVIFLLEEPSMKAFLLEFLPRLVSGWQHEQDFLLVAHEGKTDLDKSIPKKLSNWREPGARFVVVRDNDNTDCVALKARLVKLTNKTSHQLLIRLICQELESWYLGDPDSLEKAYPSAKKGIANLAKRFPDPDTCQKPSRELERDLEDFQKNDAARRMGRLLQYQNSRSISFRVFSEGVVRLAQVP
jgi:hypothetical protein